MGARNYQDRRGGYDERSSKPPFVPPSNEEIQQIIVRGDVEKLVEWADRTGKALKDQNLAANQIRNVFGTVRQIQMRWPSAPEQSYREAVLLRPKLAYFATREKKAKGRGSDGMETLQKVLEPALLLLSQSGLILEEKHQRFERFVEFFEAIVAYHKKHGGKE